MKDRSMLKEHYGPIILASYTLLMAMVIFFMALPLNVQIVLLVLSLALFAASMYPAKIDEAPMGADVGSEGIARPRPGLDSHGRRAA